MDPVRRPDYAVAALLALALVLPGAGPASRALAADAPLPGVVAAAMAAARLRPDDVSYAVVDAASGATIAAHNAAVARSPASTLKVVTTSAALDLLGPAYTWHTLALAGGPVHDGVLDGDLVLRGGGDPYLTLERWWDFARQLRHTGLRAIRGDIVIDDSAFALDTADPGAFDGQPLRLYNVAPDALLVNFLSVDFLIRPDAGRRAVTIDAEPAPPNLVIDNRIRLVPGRCRPAADRVDLVVSGGARDHVTFSGALAGSCAPREVARALMQPPHYAFGTFVSYWRELGGEFDGRMRVGVAPAGATTLLSYDSLSLGELVRLTNKYSNNVMARTLYLALGVQRYGEPATLDKSEAAIRAWGQQSGIDLAQVVIGNGSGLSREARISAETLAAVLRSAWLGRYQPEFLASLPLAGVDGTMRARMRGVPEGAVRVKSGHLAGVSAIAGYVTTADGRVAIVVSIVNDARADFDAADPLHAALVQAVLSAGPGPVPPAPTAAR